MDTRTCTANPELYLTLLEREGVDQGAIEEARIAYEYSIESEHVSITPIAIYEQDIPIGHMALIRDTQLPEGTAFFGFLFAPTEDRFSALWSALIKEARLQGIHTLKGPIDGSIWHSYRTVAEADDAPRFVSEPVLIPTHYTFLNSLGPKEEVRYVSARRTSFDMVPMLLGKASLAALPFLGCVLSEERNPTPRIMRAIAELGRRTFSGSWGYTELTESEFLSLYAPQRLAGHLSTLYLVHKGDELVGFCSTARMGEETLVVKTICIAPEYQGKGLGNALAYRLHADARERKISCMIYALIREGNGVRRFPKDGIEIFRHYAAFTFDL